MWFSSAVYGSANARHWTAGSNSCGRHKARRDCCRVGRRYRRDDAIASDVEVVEAPDAAVAVTHAGAVIGFTHPDGALIVQRAANWLHNGGKARRGATNDLGNAASRLLGVFLAGLVTLGLAPLDRNRGQAHPIGLAVIKHDTIVWIEIRRTENTHADRLTGEVIGQRHAAEVSRVNGDGEWKVVGGRNPAHRHHGDVVLHLGHLRNDEVVVEIAAKRFRANTRGMQQLGGMERVAGHDDRAGGNKPRLVFTRMGEFDARNLAAFIDDATAGGFRQDLEALGWFIDQRAEYDVGAVVAQPVGAGRCRQRHGLHKAIRIATWVERGAELFAQSDGGLIVGVWVLVGAEEPLSDSEGRRKFVSRNERNAFDHRWSGCAGRPFGAHAAHVCCGKTGKQVFGRVGFIGDEEARAAQLGGVEPACAACFPFFLAHWDARRAVATLCIHLKRGALGKIEHVVEVGAGLRQNLGASFDHQDPGFRPITANDPGICRASRPAADNDDIGRFFKHAQACSLQRSMRRKRG
uniref:PPM-type phosphatase domain-containing protein n=1 Tax=Parastrongyloides trichosuri TaxID=131310 RepID=A0A0N5A021_PARTI